jgi:hypothetical protein
MKDTTASRSPISVSSVVWWPAVSSTAWSLTVSMTGSS